MEAEKKKKVAFGSGCLSRFSLGVGIRIGIDQYLAKPASLPLLNRVLNRNPYSGTHNRLS